MDEKKKYLGRNSLPSVKQSSFRFSLPLPVAKLLSLHHQLHCPSPACCPLSSALSSHSLLWYLKCALKSYVSETLKEFASCWKCKCTDLLNQNLCRGPGNLHSSWLSWEFKSMMKCENNELYGRHWAPLFNPVFPDSSTSLLSSPHLTVLLKVLHGLLSPGNWG